MSIQNEIKQKEAELAELVKRQEEELKAKAEELAKAQADLEKAKLEAWVPTKESVREALDESRDYKTTWGKGLYNGRIKDIIRDEKTPIVFNANFTFELETIHGGGEGDGEEHWLVFSVTDVRDGISKTYWEVPGWYQSYDGGHLEWENVHQVEPVQVLVTQYKAV